MVGTGWVLGFIAVVGCWSNPLIHLAGAGGIEPPNGGIKIRCLTAWLRPSSDGANLSGKDPVPQPRGGRFRQPARLRRRARHTIDRRAADPRAEASAPPSRAR